MEIIINVKITMEINNKYHTEEEIVDLFSKYFLFSINMIFLQYIKM